MQYQSELAIVSQLSIPGLAGKYLAYNLNLNQRIKALRSQVSHANSFAISTYNNQTEGATCLYLKTLVKSKVLTNGQKLVVTLPFISEFKKDLSYLHNVNYASADFYERVIEKNRLQNHYMCDIFFSEKDDDVIADEMNLKVLSSLLEDEKLLNLVETVVIEVNDFEKFKNINLKGKCVLATSAANHTDILDKALMLTDIKNQLVKNVLYKEASKCLSVCGDSQKIIITNKIKHDPYLCVCFPFDLNRPSRPFLIKNDAKIKTLEVLNNVRACNALNYVDATGQLNAYLKMLEKYIDYVESQLAVTALKQEHNWLDGLDESNF